MKTKDGTVFCSFCGKHSDFVEMLLAGLPGKNVHICDECVEKCQEVIEKTRAEKPQQNGGQR